MSGCCFHFKITKKAALAQTTLKEIEKQQVLAY